MMASSWAGEEYAAYHDGYQDGRAGKVHAHLGSDPATPYSQGYWAGMEDGGQLTIPDVDAPDYSRESTNPLD